MPVYNQVSFLGEFRGEKYARERHTLQVVMCLSLGVRVIPKIAYKVD